MNDLSQKYSDRHILLQAIKQGDDAAFEYLFKSYYPRLRGYALHFIEEEETVRDILQECFMRFWERKHLLDSQALTSFLFVMVRNACLNHLKHQQLVEQYSLTNVSQAMGKEELYIWDFEANPEQKLMYEELRSQIDRLLHQLPDRCREVFVMSRFHHLKNREIADKLQISTTAVEKHISKALKVFSKHFKGNYPFDAYTVMFLSWWTMQMTQ